MVSRLRALSVQEYNRQIAAITINKYLDIHVNLVQRYEKSSAEANRRFDYAETEYLRRSQRYELAEYKTKLVWFLLRRILLFADGGMCDIYLRRLRGGAHQRCEPPKITPLRGAVVREAAALTTLTSCIITMFYAVRRRRSECDSSPPRGAAANCAVLRTANTLIQDFHLLSPKRWSQNVPR